MYNGSSFKSPKNNDRVERVLGKNLPCSQEAERAVLSALLLNSMQMNSICDYLVAEDFYIPAHKLIFQTMLNIAGSHRTIDVITVQDELQKTGELEKAGGIVNLLSLQEDIPALGLVSQHAQIIKEKATLRDLISSAATIISNCYTQDEKEIESVLDEAEKVIFQISHKRVAQQFVQLDIWLKKTFEHLSALKGAAKGVTGIASGFKKLDEMTSGFQKGDLVVLAGRPSMGKTAFTLNIALHAALSGKSVGFFSLEMAAEQLTLRLLSSQSGVAYQKIRNAEISSDEWVGLTNAAGNLAELKLFIDDQPLQNITDIRSKARKLKTENGLELLIIDYLQLINSTRRHENRQQEVSDISRSLKALAKELSVPVIACSQLSRAVDSRTDKRPMLSDLRESGAIEQDADLIMFLYRDVVYDKETENPDGAEVIVGKQRNGPTGVINLQFIGEYARFEDGW